MWCGCWCFSVFFNVCVRCGVFSLVMVVVYVELMDFISGLMLVDFRVEMKWNLVKERKFSLCFRFILIWLCWLFFMLFYLFILIISVLFDFSMKLVMWVFCLEIFCCVFSSSSMMLVFEIDFRVLIMENFLMVLKILLW